MPALNLATFGLDGFTGPRLLKLGKRATGSFFGHGCLQLAAAIAYHALLSIFPLVIFVVWVGTWFLDDASARGEIVELIADQVALSADGEADIAAQLERAAKNAGAAGLVAIPLLLWSASAMMTSVRHGINVAWGLPARRQFLRGKLLDIGFVALLGALAIGSIGLTLLSRLLPDTAASFWSIASLLIPVAVTFIGFLVVFRFLPSVRTYVRDVWPAALLAAVALEGLKIGFAFYLKSIANNDAVYGSLGAVISLLLFIYLTAAILLLTAAFAAELPRVRAGLYDHDEPPPDGGGGLLQALRNELHRAKEGRPEEEFRLRRPSGPSD